MTVPVELAPPTNDDGDSDRLSISDGVTVRFAVSVVTLVVAKNLTVVEVPTSVVATEKLAEVAPAATVTLAGTVALGLFEDRKIILPPGPAGPLRLTDPAAVVPPGTDNGDTLRDTSSAGLTVILAIFAVALNTAATDTDVALDVAKVVIVKDAVVAPAATVTDLGTLAETLLVERLTVEPP